VNKRQVIASKNFELQKRCENKKKVIEPASFYFLLTWLIQAKCEYLESVEAAKTATPSLLNWSAASENAMISVGQTKVKSNG
jgi:hypothetical protein